MMGSIGSICSSDYTSQLSNIGNYVATDTLNAPKQLACNPDAASVSIVTSPTGYESQIQAVIDAQTKKIYFYNLPIGVKVTYSYDCPRFF